MSNIILFGMTLKKRSSATEKILLLVMQYLFCLIVYHHQYQHYESLQILKQIQIHIKHSTLWRERKKTINNLSNNFPSHNLLLFEDLKSHPDNVFVTIIVPAFTFIGFVPIIIYISYNLFKPTILKQNTHQITS
jgi:hypothetical protein